MRRFEAEEEAEEAEALSKSGKDDDFHRLLLPCWRAVARKLRVASARDAQKEVLRRAGWETCVLSCSPSKICCAMMHVSRRRKARAFSLSLSFACEGALLFCIF